MAIFPFVPLLGVYLLHKAGHFASTPLLDVLLLCWMLVASLVVFVAVLSTFGALMVILLAALFSVSIYLTSALQAMQRRWANPGLVPKKHVTKKEKRKNLKKTMKDKTIRGHAVD
jgi:hypothetical protein